MSVYFTSDLHLGHNLASRLRGFKSVQDHDEFIVARLQSSLSKNDKLFVLGDVAFKPSSLELLRELPFTMDLLLGNHDGYPTLRYLEFFRKIIGPIKYRETWLSHIPIHSQEIYRCRGNIHGHIHHGVNADLSEFDPRYFNVNVEYHNFYPVPFEMILSRFPKAKGGLND